MMQKNLHLHWIKIIILGLALPVTGCQPPPPVLPTLVASLAPPDTPTPPPAASPSSTPSPLPTLTPTPTLSPTPTSTPTPALPYPMGMPFPVPAEPISAKNASQLVELARWGGAYPLDTAWSADLSTLVVATSVDVRVLDLQSRQERYRLDQEGSQVIRVAVSPDAKYLALVHFNVIELRQLSDGELVVEIKGHESSILRLAFSTDGSYLVSGAADGTVRLWEMPDGLEARSFKVYDTYRECVWTKPPSCYDVSEIANALSLAFPADFSWMAAGVAGQYGAWMRSGLYVWVWKLESGALVRQPTPPEGYEIAGGMHLAASPDGAWLATDLENGEVLVWSTQDWRWEYRWPTGGFVTQLSFDPQSRYLAAATDSGSLHVWQVSDGQQINRWDGHALGYLGFTFSQEGGQLLSVDKGLVVRTWKISQPEPLDEWWTEMEPGAPVFPVYIQIDLSWQANGLPVWASEWIRISADGNTLASLINDTTPGIWQINSGELITTLEEAESRINNLVVSSNANLLAAATKNYAVQVWDTLKGGPPVTMDFTPREYEYIRCLAFWPDDQTVAFDTSERYLYLFSALDGKRLGQMALYPDSIINLYLSSDGDTLATRIRDLPELRLWSLKKGEVTRTLTGNSEYFFPAGVAFSPDGSQVAVSSRYNKELQPPRILLFDVSSGKILQQIDLRASIYDFSFSPDGKIIIGYTGTTIHLWQVSDGHLLATLQGHEGEIVTCGFALEGRVILAASMDGTIRIWGAPP